ncbi:MAG: aldehyde dehydrogenase family protein [Phycisphaerales bacterium]|nr:aldehyde dehydrogenase family protein [Phycisphaerales bacterium]
MTHIHILRRGQPYESIDKIELVHHATGEVVATVSQANPGMIVRDINRMNDAVLEAFTVRELIDICRRAAERFIGGVLPIGDAKQSFDDYVRQLSATTGMPVTYCRGNAEKIRRVLAEMDTIIAGLTRGFDLDILDRGYGLIEGRTLSFYREGRIFGAVLPSNSPGVHGLWIPAIALKAPIVLKPGREEPWTPLRIIEALAAEGVPREAFGFYPTDHAGAGELLRSVDRAMLFGDTATTAPWKNDPRVEIHGPGFSKVILGDDAADDWERHLDIMEGSIAANGGRSCINASGVWTPRNGRKIAEALAKRLAKVQALPADDSKATIAGFANPAMAERMSAMIDHQLRSPGAVDLTEQFRGSSRLVKKGRVSYLLPTILWCEDREHPLANREFLFPFASVVECPTTEMPEAIGRSLVVSAITKDQRFIASLMASPNVDRLNFGPIPTYQLSWDQPHEGNLFEHLYRQRSFQIEPAS